MENFLHLEKNSSGWQTFRDADILSSGRDSWSREEMGSCCSQSFLVGQIWEVNLGRRERRKCGLPQNLFLCDFKTYLYPLNKNPKVITIVYFCFDLFLIPQCFKVLAYSHTLKIS